MRRIDTAAPAALEVEADYSDLEINAYDFNGFEDESDWEYDLQFGGEDSHLDAYWEGINDFWE